MIRLMLGVLLAGISATSAAETLDFSEFSIDLAPDWAHEIERSTAGGAAGVTAGELISIYHPDGIGVLKMQTLVLPYNVGRDRLRNLTNIDYSTILAWQEWGEFSGYEHSYIERGSFYKQWWLLSQGTILLVTYESDADEQQVEIDTIDTMLGSIKTGTQ